MLKKLYFKHTSFLVTVKDEEFFSKKLVSYINKKNIDAEFIIVDGSKKKQKKIFDKLNIKKKKYFYLGEDINYSIYFKKVLFGINECSNKFIFYCDQDDLINFTSIKNHEDFLTQNSNYSAVKGVVFNFRYFKNKIDLIGKDYNDYIDFNFFLMRYFFNPNFKAYYCLHRKKNLKTVFNLVNKHNLKEGRSSNFLTAIITLSSGRIKFYKDVSILRWSGLKKRDKKKLNDHVVNEVHKTRYLWFKYFFFKEKNLIVELIRNQKIFWNNFTIFKIYYFIFDIVMNMLRRNFLRIFKKKKINNSRELFDRYKLNNIVDKSNLLKTN
tara:strand:- start:282 stop:1253 length:972 start_codon:yes stop_codon:yes gene_type:complete